MTTGIRHIRTIEGDALILSATDARDDKIVRLLMEDDELVPALVKHGRRSGKTSRGGRIQPLTAVRVTLRARPADDLALLEKVDVELPFAVIKGDLLRLAMASCMAEVVLHLCPDWGREVGLFDLLLRAWQRLDRPDRSDQVSSDWLLLFELKALATSGVLPPIDALTEVSPAGRDVLQGWLEGRWAPLDATSRKTVDALFETLLTSASGRPFRSKGLLAEALR